MTSLLTMDRLVAESVRHAVESASEPLDGATRRLLEARIPHPHCRASILGGFTRSPVLGCRYADPSAEALEREAVHMARAAMRSSRSAAKRTHGFRHIRVHTGPAATRAADLLNSAAFAVGNHVVFGLGRYCLDSEAGRELLAHELVHCLQHRESPLLVVQRTEVDEAAVPLGIRLQDSVADIDRYVNDVLRQARVGTASGVEVVERVYDELGATGVRFWVAGIEAWAELLPVATRSTPGKIFYTPQDSTKYRGVGYRGWRAGNHTLAPVMLVSGVRMGSDKIGHFFQLGHEYYLRSFGTADPKEFGRASELGVFGASNTGVYSPADLEANTQGMKFYRDLRRTARLTFSIRTYVSDKWDERQNPCRYTTDVGQVVWGNLLTGTWEGQFTHPGARGQVPISAELQHVAGTALTGVFAYGASTATVHGTLNGTVTFRRDRNRLITGVAIAFTWTSGSNSGRGSFRSHGETMLDGTWGNGTATTGGGTWQLYKVG